MQKITLNRHIATSLSFMFLLSSAMAMQEEPDKQTAGTLVQPAVEEPTDKTVAVTVATSMSKGADKDEFVTVTEEHERFLLSPLRIIWGGKYTVTVQKKKSELETVKDTEPPVAVSATPVEKHEDVLTQEQLSALTTLDNHKNPKVKTKVNELTHLLLQAKIEEEKIKEEAN